MIKPLSFELCRTFFDLAKPHPNAPLHVYESDLYADWMLRGETDRIGTNMSMPPVYRKLLVAESRLHMYEAPTPQDLPAHLRSERWQAFVEHLEAWETLDSKQRFANARILLALTYHKQASGSLLAGLSERDIASDPYVAALFYLNQFAAFITCRRIDQIPELFFRIAKDGPVGSLARVQSRITISHLFLDYVRQSELAEPWILSLPEEFEALSGTVPANDRKRLLVRYHTLTARLQEEQNTVRLLESYQQVLDILQSQTVQQPEDQILREEAKRRALDQFSLQARRSNDLELATRFAQEALQVDPNEGKAHWLLADLYYLQGNFREAAMLYRRAARLGPLATSRSWFMAGQCHEQLREAEVALDCYQAALETDPESPSVWEALHRCAQHLGIVALADWAQSTLNSNTSSAKI